MYNFIIVDVNVLLSPLCYSQFKLGKPTEESLCISEFITRTITNSGCFDLSQLCIEKNKAVWVLRVSILCTNYDGSLLDACFLSLLGALKDLKIPSAIKGEDEQYVIDRSIIL